MRANGFSLVGLLVAIVLSGILLIGLTTVFMGTLDRYSYHENFIDMQRNGTTVLDKMTDVITQAGADIPSEEISLVLNGANHDDLTTIENPTGGIYYCQYPQPASTSVFVENAVPFRGFSRVRKLYSGTTVTYTDLTINTSNNTAPFTNGIDSANGRISLTTSEPMNRDDAIYLKKVKRYYLDYTVKALKCSVETSTYLIAENVDSLWIGFYTKNRVATTNWPEFSLCSLVVRVMAPKADRNYKVTTDHIRRTVLGKMFLLRNRKFVI